jgi:hypothetical protein
MTKDTTPTIASSATSTAWIAREGGCEPLVPIVNVGGTGLKKVEAPAGPAVVAQWLPTG